MFFQKNLKKQFFSSFFSRKKLFELRNFENIKEIRGFSAKKQEKNPMKKFAVFFKIYKDQINEKSEKNERFAKKQRTLNENELNFFLGRQNACFAIIMTVFSREKMIIRCAWKKILRKAIESVKAEEITGFKAFQKYSIILLPFKGLFSHFFVFFHFF